MISPNPLNAWEEVGRQGWFCAIAADDGLLMVWMVSLATFLTSALSSVFGMLGDLLLMAILVEWFSVPHAFVLHGLFQLTAKGY